jgi:hypothetical protein
LPKSQTRESDESHDTVMTAANKQCVCKRKRGQDSARVFDSSHKRALRALLSHGAAEINRFDLGILNPIYERELNQPDVAHARAAVCVQRPSSAPSSEVVPPPLNLLRVLVRHHQHVVVGIISPVVHRRVHQRLPGAVLEDHGAVITLWGRKVDEGVEADTTGRGRQLAAQAQVMANVLERQCSILEDPPHCQRVPLPRHWRQGHTVLLGGVRCFIDATFGHSLGPGVSRAGRGRSSPQLFRGAPGLVLPVTRAIAWGDPAN